MKRRTVALFALAGLLLFSGCLGGGGVSEERLNRNVTYDWQTDANVTVNVTATEYHAVYEIRNRTVLNFTRETELSGNQPVSVAGVKFRYPNGTVVGADHLQVTEEGSKTVVRLPADQGKFAYTASSGSRSVHVPVAVSGSHEVILPPGVRASVPLFGSVEPSADSRTVNETTDRVHYRWKTVDANTISIDYYLQRDLYIFAGLVGLLVLVGIGGVVYYRLKIRRLERERTEMGLDLEEE
ncbi:DUF5803 family protein [Halospeciosus flavus]|uniref:DUF5803 family protein n=1 Tax=Halospeciosus flavus TaxID=3032283 RepID=A0ABD5Z3W5_9EURY|nr:DUF5803 family protein [Halospeciosus flavus]